MPTDAEQLAFLRTENVKLNEQLKAAQIDAADALFKLSRQSRTWSDSVISLATWIGTNKAGIAATFIFFWLAYREQFPKLPTPAPVNSPVRVAPVAPQQPAEVKGGAVPLREGK